MKNRPITLCGQRLNGPRHLCAFFDSREDQYAAFLPYFREGLENQEQVVYILDRSRNSEAKHQLTEFGIDVERRMASNQLQILSADETYIRGGIFAADRMFGMLEDVLRAARSGPFGHVRTLGEMDWALRDLPGMDELMEYECRVNYLLETYDCTLCCSYDVSRISGQALMDILCTHSHVVMGTTVQQNPYFMSPDEFRLYSAKRRRLPPTLLRA